MSLKYFHLIFIVASVVLSGYGTYWGVRLYMLEKNVPALVTGIFFFLMGVALIAYGRRAAEKLRHFV